MMAEKEKMERPEVVRSQGMVTPSKASGVKSIGESSGIFSASKSPSKTSAI